MSNTLSIAALFGRAAIALVAVALYTVFVTAYEVAKAFLWVLAVGAALVFFFDASLLSSMIQTFQSVDSISRQESIRTLGLITGLFAFVVVMFKAALGMMKYPLFKITTDELCEIVHEVRVALHGRQKTT